MTAGKAQVRTLLSQSLIPLSGTSVLTHVPSADAAAVRHALGSLLSSNAVVGVNTNHDAHCIGHHWARPYTRRPIALPTPH